MLRTLPESAAREATELDLLTELSVVLLITKGFAAPETIEVSARAADLAEKSGNLGQIVLQLHLSRVGAMTAGEHKKAAAIAGRMLEVARARRRSGQFRIRSPRRVSIALLSWRARGSGSGLRSLDKIPRCRRLQQNGRDIGGRGLRRGKLVRLDSGISRSRPVNESPAPSRLRAMVTAPMTSSLRVSSNTCFIDRRENRATARLRGGKWRACRRNTISRALQGAGSGGDGLGARAIWPSR